MKKTITATLFIALVGGCTLSAVSNDGQTSSSSPASAADLAADLSRLERGEWSGSLFYLDYSNGTREEIPVGLKFEPVVGNRVRFAIKYPGETQYNARETYTWKADGSRLNDAAIVSRTGLPNGQVEIITEADGEDDSRAARIRTTYLISDDQFIVRKDVKFVGEDAFFNRNEYALSR